MYNARHSFDTALAPGERSGVDYARGAKVPVKGPGRGMSDKEKGGFWTTLPGFLTAIAALLTAIVGLWAAISDGDEEKAGSPTREASPVVSLAVQAAVLNPSERTRFKTHDVTVRVMTAGPSTPEIDHVTYLLPPSFATQRVTRSSADD